MSIASEILEHMAVAEVAEAVVVTPDSTVMYDDPLLQDLKEFTVEELYEKLDEELTEKLKIQKPTPEDCVKILGYLSEFYRRGIHFQSTNPDLMNRGKNAYRAYERPQVVLEWWDYDVVNCSHCHKVIESDEIRSKSTNEHSYSTYCLSCRVTFPDHDIKASLIQTKGQSIECHHRSIVYQLRQMLQVIKMSLDKSLSTLKKIKAIQLASLKKPRVCEEINGLMDAILDANGNKISEFKDYLSPEHYRIIRAGRDISEIKEQDELLTCLKHMKSKLVYPLPSARGHAKLSMAADKSDSSEQQRKPSRSAAGGGRGMGIGIAYDHS